MKTVHLNPGANGKKDKPYSYCLSSDRVPIYYCTPNKHHWNCRKKEISKTIYKCQIFRDIAVDMSNVK